MFRVTLPVDAIDADDDGWTNAFDNCALRTNADQADANGDRVGDVCQCGDMNGNGLIDGADLTLYKRFFGGLVSPFRVAPSG